MTEPIATKVMVAMKTAAGKVTPIEASARPATIKASAKPAPVKAGSTEAAAGKSAAAVPLRHRVAGCKNANRETNCYCSNLSVVRNIPMSLHFSFH
jgi:hypothetical protein